MLGWEQSVIHSLMAHYKDQQVGKWGRQNTGSDTTTQALKKWQELSNIVNFYFLENSKKKSSYNKGHLQIQCLAVHSAIYIQMHSWRKKKKAVCNNWNDRNGSAHYKNLVTFVIHAKQSTVKVMACAVFIYSKGPQWLVKEDSALQRKPMLCFKNHKHSTSLVHVKPSLKQKYITNTDKTLSQQNAVHFCPFGELVAPRAYFKNLPRE